MAWQELLSLFQGSAPESPEASLGRLITKLDELLAAMEAVELAEKEKAGPPLIRLEWRACGLSLQPLEDLEKRLARVERERLKSIRKRLEAARSKLCSGEHEARLAELHEVRESLIIARRELEIFSAGLRDVARRDKLWRGALMLAPVLLGSAAVYYLRTDRGLRLEQIEALAPSAAYFPVDKTDGALLPRPDYLNDFMTEFSKHYFGHTSQFESLYYDTPQLGKDDKDDKPSRSGGATKQRTLQHKIVLRNASQGQVVYLSSIEAIAEVSEKLEFPWTRLNVSPHVAALFDVPPHHRSLRVKSDGIGPALDVVSTVTTAKGLLLCKSEIPIFHRDDFAPFKILAVDYVGVEGKEGTLAAPRYYRLDEKPATLGSRFFEVKERPPTLIKDTSCEPNHNAEDFGWYEEVRSLARLRELVPTAYAEPYTLEVRYTSIKGAPDTLRLSGTLEGTEVFYAHHPKLYNHDPRCAMAATHDVDNLTVNPLLDGLAFALAPDKELLHPKGTDLITARLGIDLQDGPVGRRYAATHPLDGFLNPQGVLSLQLSLHMPTSARYTVRIAVSGRQVTRYKFDGLVPEQLTFADEGSDAAVSRLRKLFAAEQRR